MTSAELDVTGIGHAIVDVISKAEDGFLSEHSMDKGAMMLIEEAQAESIYGAMGPGVESSGGSAANTMAGIASCGGDAAFIGKVRDDQLGEVFAHDIRAIGVRYETSPATDGAATARCLILVTPDAQRTMNTFLGAAAEFSPDDVNSDLIAAAQVTYLEGYLWDRDAAKAAFLKAAEVAHAAGRKVSLTLSDAFCVDRHRDSFLDLVDGHIDILFANEAEITSLYQTDSFDEALAAVRGKCEIAALTRSEKGAVIVVGDEAHEVAAVPVERVVDTTGAGDQYAAGFLYGITNGHSPAESGRIGAIAAAEVISHIGARPQKSLKALVAERL